MEHRYPQRKPLRLPDYNYSLPGVYFLTLCTKDRIPFFGRISGFNDEGIPTSQLTPIGKLVEQHIRDIPKYYANVSVDHFVIMPNHIHMLLFIETANGAPGSSRPTELVPRIISAMKRLTNKASGQKLWQERYMDHVIRNEQDYVEHWNYIEHNPFRWAEDKYHI